METMKAARLHAIGDFRVDEIPVPRPGGREILLKVGACGVCGSDIPRIFELGTSRQKYPLTIGHEFAGAVEQVGPDADPCLVGKRGAVFPCIPCRRCEPCLSGNYAMCLDYDYLGSRSDGGFAEYCLVPSAWHFVESTNPDTSLEALAMAEPCTVAQHAVRRSGIGGGSSLLIFGAGPIGIMAARWAELFGAEVVALVDIADDKIGFAKARGMKHVLNGLARDVADEFRKICRGRLPDAIIEGTGTGAALNQAVECSKTFGTVVLMGNPHQDTVIKLSAHSNILRRELSLKGMWNSHYFDMPVNEWTYTVRMLDQGKITVEDLITHRSDVDGIPAMCRGIYDRTLNICKAMFTAKA
ncbi:MAG TPA: galactitol-1-phosphate 5-dehydrogenase [Anaerovoracaceae bacterium]|nr:galactitol-1-phosphate 5-dehydrogenase [Anaerovoracaceae bacterium]